MKPISTFLSGIILLGLGCKQAAPTEQNSANSGYDTFFPLEVGNYWIYGSNGQSLDTAEKSLITKKIFLGGYEYFQIENEHISFQRKNISHDTTYLRFSAKDKLYWFIQGKDSLYVDFTNPTPYHYGGRYPGYRFNIEEKDSTVLGWFDSCRYIAFGANAIEPLFATYSAGVGIIESDIISPGTTCQLIGAKIGNKIISLK